jgi:hypothetical protein
MTIEGYVTIQNVNGANMTAPAGLSIYLKEQNTTIPNISGSINVTDSNGYYLLGIDGSNVPPQGTPLDVWVQGINVTRIMLNYPTYAFLSLNLTVIDITPPAIQIVWPQPNSVINSTQPLWVNATVTDDLLINETSIAMTLNQTQLVPNYDNTTGLVSNQTGPPTPGFYVANLTASDIAGNTAVQTWNFTATVPTANETSNLIIGTPYQNPPGQNVAPGVTLQVNNDTDVTVSANITDTISITNATLSYNNGSGWVNQTMSATGNLYAATIPGQPQGTNVTYYITATDSLNYTRSPTGQLYYPYTVIPEFGSFMVLLLVLVIGTTLVIVMSKTKRARKVYH